MKIEQLGGLATAIFERVASTDGVSRTFLGRGGCRLRKSVGREVRVEFSRS
jgi:hypothetical protein